MLGDTVAKQHHQLDFFARLRIKKVAGHEIHVLMHAIRPFAVFRKTPESSLGVNDIFGGVTSLLFLLRCYRTSLVHLPLSFLANLRASYRPSLVQLAMLSIHPSSFQSLCFSSRSQLLPHYGQIIHAGSNKKDHSLV